MARPLTQRGLGWAAKNDHSTPVASRASLGGSRFSIAATLGAGGRPPGQTWPAPEMVIRPTSIPAGPEAISVRTGGSSLTRGAPQPPARRQRSITEGTEGRGRRSRAPAPTPPEKATLRSSRPWRWRTDTGAGNPPAGGQSHTI